MRRKMAIALQRVTRRMGASMRPARYAPENWVDAKIGERFGSASMRPARYAPENAGSRAGGRFPFAGFNEAGALCAGKCAE